MPLKDIHLNNYHQPAGAYRIKRLKNLAPEAKPREKLLKEGAKNLSVAELLAVVINIGTKKEDVLSMSNRLLQEYGTKGTIRHKNPKQIQKNCDIPLYQACRLVACFELGRRFYQKPPGSKIFIRTPQQAFTVLKGMASLGKEQFRGLYLNTHYQLIHDEVIALGTLDTAVFQVRDVFQPALERSAVAIIIAHNHPSGILKFSAADEEITKKLKISGNILGVALLDHILISHRGFVSAADRANF